MKNLEALADLLEEALWERDLAKDYLDSLEVSGSASDEEMADAVSYFRLTQDAVEFWTKQQPAYRVLN